MTAELAPLFDDDCSAVPKQDQCNSGKNCTWCESNQEPPGCFLLSSSRDLPPKIYQCDKQPQLILAKEEQLNAVEVETETPESEESENDRHRHEHHEHHGHHGEGHHHGHHGPRHHHCCCAGPVVLAITLILHAWFQKKHFKAIKELKELKGEDTSGKCGWKGKCKEWKNKQCGQQQAQAPPV